MRLSAKIVIDMLVIGLMVSLAPPAMPAFARANNPGADAISPLAAGTADNKNKSGNKGRHGKNRSAKDKPRVKTKNAGQKARTETSDKCLVQGAGTRPAGALL
jgi:hypothetical protein